MVCVEYALTILSLIRLCRSFVILKLENFCNMLFMVSLVDELDWERLGFDFVFKD